MRGGVLWPDVQHHVGGGDATTDGGGDLLDHGGQSGMVRSARARSVLGLSVRVSRTTHQKSPQPPRARNSPASPARLNSWRYAGGSSVASSRGGRAPSTP